MNKYFLIRFTYDKEIMGDNTTPVIQVSKKRLFVEAIGFDAACRKIVRQYNNARLFHDLIIR
jgi:hypothetical protein